MKNIFLFSFILLHSPHSGTPIWFNIDHIITISPGRDRVYIRTVNNPELVSVRESIDEIINMIQKEK